jgi:hypothetical protein
MQRFLAGFGYKQVSTGFNQVADIKVPEKRIGVLPYLILFYVKLDFPHSVKQMDKAGFAHLTDLY